MGYQFFCMIYLLFLVNSILNVLNLIQSKKSWLKCIKGNKVFFCVCELGFFYFSYFNIAHNTISSFTKFLHVFNFSWYNTLLLIFVVFDRFINQVLLLCCFADKCHSVCENGWDLLKIVLLQEIHCFFWHFSYLQSVSPATCQFTKCTNVQCHGVTRSVLGFT